MGEIKWYAFHPGEALILIIILCGFFLAVEWMDGRRLDRNEKRRAEILRNRGNGHE